MKPLVLITLFVAFLLTIPYAKPLTLNSTGKEFNATPGFVELNWTNSYMANITLGNMEDYNVTIGILNRTRIFESYSQENTGNCNPLTLLVKNVTHYTNETLLPPYQTRNMTIIFNLFECKPGKYSGYLDIINVTNSSENLSISVTVHNPISLHNLPELKNGTSFFSGILPKHSNETHYYFFNTSEVRNTGITFKINTSLDLFLYDESENLIGTTAGGEGKTLGFNYLPKNEMWKLVVYGNVSEDTPYTVEIALTGLNITNATNQQLSPIDFGVQNASFSSQLNLTLRNEANFTLANVSELKEFYHVDRLSASGNSSLTFLVPDYAQRVEVWLNWTGSSNYTLKVFNPDGSIVGIRVPKYKAYELGLPTFLTLNLTNPKEGFWKVSVTNNTNVTENYSLEARVYVDPESWIKTNYNITSFNVSGSPNSSATVQLNFSVPSNAMDGLYEGSLIYVSSSGSLFKIPIRINVTVPEFSQNGILRGKEYSIVENVGMNLTKVLNITFNNTGSYDVYLDSHLNSSVLSKDNSYVNFTYESPKVIRAGESGTINVTIFIDASMGTGVYSGWIYLNLTNSSNANFTGHPYDSFNISIKLKLSDALKVDLIDAKSLGNDEVIDPSKNENVTLTVNVSFVNSTPITTLTKENFTVWLVENHVGHTISLNVYKSSYNSTRNEYKLNVTVPSGQVGGNYTLNIKVTYKAPKATLTGSDSWESLLINNPGLYLSSSTGTVSIWEGDVDYFKLTVTNYGPKKASGDIWLEGSCAASITATNSSTGASKSGRKFSGINVAGNGSTAWFEWKIDASNVNVSETETCNLNVMTNDPKFNSISLTVEIKNKEIPTGETPPGGTEGKNETIEARYLEIVSYPTLVEIEEGKWKEIVVSVKNVNDTKSQQVTLSIEGINSSWYEITPSTTFISPNKTKDFKVNFSIPNDANVGDYKGKFVTKSSYEVIEKNFTLRVLFSEEKRKEINTTIAMLSENATLLGDEIQKLKDEGYNVTLAQKEFSNLLQLLSQAKTAIQRKDFLKAYQLLGEIRKALNSTKEAIAKIKRTQKPGFFATYKWIIIALASVAIGILIYLFWPETEEKKKVVEWGRDSWSKLKEKWSGKRWSTPRERSVLQRIKEKMSGKR